LKLLISRGLGRVALAEGKFVDASTLFAEAAAKASGPDGAYHRMWALDGLARSRLGAGDQVGAADAYRRAMTIAEEVRARFRSDEFKAGFFGDVQQIFDGAVSTFADAGQVEAAFEASERSRARGFQDLVRGRITAKAAAEVLVESTGRPPSLSQIVAHVPEGMALVEYYISDKRTVAWVIRRSGARMTLLNVGRSILSEEARRFRTLIETRNADANQLGEVLYAQLIQPLGLVDDEALVVIPHGTLHYLPFQALRGGRGYLIEERAISYAPSASVLDYLLSNKNGNRLSILALGNPDLGSLRLSLPGAEREVVQIKALFPGAEVFIGKEASKDRLVTKAPQSDVVHVGAHADLDEIDPLYSTIRLAGTDGHTGDLEAHEVYAMSLSRVSLVTLSACSTGLGKVSRGDELWGFTRTFFAAGARSIMVSLWAVEDVSTSILMEKFYGRLREADSQQALRGAQLDVLRDDPKFSHPFYWAPFNLVGAWQ
jgi:CHAT domain-containing protein